MVTSGPRTGSYQPRWCALIGTEIVGHITRKDVRLAVVRATDAPGATTRPSSFIYDSKPGRGP
jgi:hypothetical protein